METYIEYYSLHVGFIRKHWLWAWEEISIGKVCPAQGPEFSPWRPCNTSTEEAHRKILEAY